MQKITVKNAYTEKVPHSTSVRAVVVLSNGTHSETLHNTRNQAAAYVKRTIASLTK